MSPFLIKAPKIRANAITMDVWGCAFCAAAISQPRTVRLHRAVERHRRIIVVSLRLVFSKVLLLIIHSYMGVLIALRNTRERPGHAHGDRVGNLLGAFPCPLQTQGFDHGHREATSDAGLDRGIAEIGIGRGVLLGGRGQGSEDYQQGRSGRALCSLLADAERLLGLDCRPSGEGCHGGSEAARLQGIGLH